MISVTAAVVMVTDGADDVSLVRAVVVTVAVAGVVVVE